MRIVLSSDGSVELLRGERITRGQDLSRRIYVEWNENESPIDTGQILTDNMAVQLCITRPDGEQSGWYSMIKIDAEDKYYYTLQAWDTAVSGEASLQVRWYDITQEEANRIIEVSNEAFFIVDNGKIAQPLNLSSENYNDIVMQFLTPLSAQAFRKYDVNRLPNTVVFQQDGRKTAPALYYNFTHTVMEGDLEVEKKGTLLVSISDNVQHELFFTNDCNVYIRTQHSNDFFSVFNKNVAGIENLFNSVSTNAINIEQCFNDIATNSEELEKNSRDIKNLYTIFNGTVTLTENLSESYRLRKTANNLDGLIDGALTKITRIQGQTIREKSLINLERDIAETFTTEGITFTHYRDGSIKITGKNKGSANSVYVLWKDVSGNNPLDLSNGYFLISGMPVGVTGVKIFGRNVEDTKYVDLYPYFEDRGFKHFSLAENNKFRRLYLSIEKGNSRDYTLNPVVIKPHISKGSLIESSINQIVSTGDNLFNQDNLLNGNWTKTTFNGFDCFVSSEFNSTIFPCYVPMGSTVTFSFDWAYENGIDLYISCEYSDGTQENLLGRALSDSRNFEKIKATKTFTKDLVGITISSYGDKTVYLKDIMVNFGAEPLNYVAFKEFAIDFNYTDSLGKWDYIDLLEKKIYNQTLIYTFNGEEIWKEENGKFVHKLDIGSDLTEIQLDSVSNFFEEGRDYVVENGKIYILEKLAKTFLNNSDFESKLKNYARYGIPFKIALKRKNVKVSDLLLETNKYPVWVKGTERVERANDIGIEPIISNTYVLKKGV